MYYVWQWIKRQLRSLWTYICNFFRHAAAYVKKIRTEGMTQEQKHVFLVGGIFVVICIVFCLFMSWLIGSIATDPSGFEVLVSDHFVLAFILYALVNTLQVFAAFIPGEPLEIAAGYLFGVWGGVLVVEVGLALGSAIIFTVSKRFGLRFVHLFVSQERLDEISFLNDSARLNIITFLIMFIPGTPKDFMCYIMGLTSMKLHTWLLISIPARVLSIVTSTIVGAQMAESNWGIAILIFAIACCVSVFGMLYYVSITRQAREAALLDELGHTEWVKSGCRTNDAESKSWSNSDNTADSYLREIGRYV